MGASKSGSHDSTNAELEQLRAAHQKLQAEAISLRAKANLLTEEEQETQAEIVKVASSIAKLSMELSGLREQVTDKKARLAEAVFTLKAQKEKME